jgi:hypothetical protein
MLTEKGLHPRQAVLPAHVLAVDLAQVGHVERVLVAGLAHVVVDALNTAAKGLADEALGQGRIVVVVVGGGDAHAMVGDRAGDQGIAGELRLLVVYVVDVDIVGITLNDGGSHNHIPRGKRDVCEERRLEDEGVGAQKRDW